MVAFHDLVGVGIAPVSKKPAVKCLTALLTVIGTRLEDPRIIGITKGCTKFFDDDSISHYFYRKGWLPIFSTSA